MSTMSKQPNPISYYESATSSTTSSPTAVITARIFYHPGESVRFLSSRPTSIDTVPPSLLNFLPTQPTDSSSQHIVNLIEERTLKSQWTCRILRTASPQEIGREDEDTASCSLLCFVGEEAGKPNRGQVSKTHDRLTTDVHIFKCSLDEEGREMHTHFGTWEKVNIILPKPWANRYLTPFDWKIMPLLDKRQFQKVGIESSTGEAILPTTSMRMELCICDMTFSNTENNEDGITNFRFSLLGRDPQQTDYVRFMIVMY